MIGIKEDELANNVIKSSDHDKAEKQQLKKKFKNINKLRRNGEYV